MEKPYGVEEGGKKGEREGGREKGKNKVSSHPEDPQKAGQQRLVCVFVCACVGFLVVFVLALENQQ